MRSFAVLALSSAGAVLAAPALAQPLKIGIIESLSGSQTSTGRLYATGFEYGLNLVNSKGGFNGAPIEVIEYDNGGNSAGAADKFKQAVADGVHIVIQGSSSAIAGQRRCAQAQSPQSRKGDPVHQSRC
jgi:branched-chain amino acid transport system substrate-binding protein